MVRITRADRAVSIRWGPRPPHVGPALVTGIVTNSKPVPLNQMKAQMVQAS
jgi:hypothetical protein